ncbi:MAG: SDR family oxidoreductase [candidate division KSB1 bacterium]|nr:SDR family oxidoreductase [candidate division KSB1 bacterium]MDZ7302571.1 SDR family oxidoreductase [candidate division KSB1 bacterium]MDZ7311588.1 SDR family oxidoreductase [candidate division KSB1 bacterium]
MLESVSAIEKLALPGLQERTVLITGASRGIGRAAAELFARCGAAVAVNSRSAETAGNLAAELQKLFAVRTFAAVADVADVIAVRNMFEKLQDWSHGRLDVLVCCAGYPLLEALWHTPLHEMNEDEVAQWFQHVRAVDLDGARFCSHFALKIMVPQRHGSLIYVSSTPALSGYHGTPYTEAKAGLLGLMRDLAREYGPYGIRANAVAPGNIASGWYHQLPDSRKQELATEAPLHRWGRPEEVAGAIVFLASDLAGFITGQTIVVDGGKVMR